jgi:thioredoxin 1
LAQQFGVQSIPTMILFKNGNEVERLVGAAPEEKVKEFSTT